MDKIKESIEQTEVKRIRSELRFVFVLFMVSLALNVYLGLKFRSQQPINTLETDLIGISVQQIEAHELTGRAVTLQLSEQAKPTLVYVFSPDCKWCFRNSNAFSSLANQIGGQYQVIALSLSGDNVKHAIDEFHVTTSVYVVPSKRTIDKLHLGATPQTILVDKNGIIRQNWIGAYLRGNKDDIEKALKVTLPNIDGDGR